MSLAETVSEMRTLAAAMIMAAMLLGPVGLMGTAGAADGNRDLTPIIIGPVATDRLGGGDLIAVKAGDALFGVRYGSVANPNDIVIFADYKRFLGGAEIVDGDGNHLATRGIPVYTVLAQSLRRFIEFRVDNPSEGYDLTSVDMPLSAPLTRNVPIKALSLVAAWQLTGPTVVNTTDGTTYVNFTVGATDLVYTRISDLTNISDGMLNAVAFTFHLKIDTREKTAEVAWYRVVVGDGTRYEIRRVEFLGLRNVTGPVVSMGAKYDHLIVGWDFAYPGDRLALETNLVVGNYFPDRTAEFIHSAVARERADDRVPDDRNRTSLGDRTTLNETVRKPPELYTRDRVYFNDDYTRIGRFQWATNVTVDGRADTMTFNLQGGGRLRLLTGGAVFLGFWLRGAFVYPAGQVIMHDPELSAEAVLSMPSAVNMTPLSILAAQVAVVGLAMGPALYLRRKARRPS